jgi:hypothetical protein
MTIYMCKLLQTAYTCMARAGTLDRTGFFSWGMKDMQATPPRLLVMTLPQFLVMRPNNVGRGIPQGSPLC